MRSTPHSYKNITPYVIDNPYGVDSPIKDLQAHFNTIPWLEKSFNRAAVMTKLNDENDQITFPKGWVAENVDEINMIGLDNFNSYSFFCSQENEQPEDYELGIDSRFSRDVSLYVWFNSDALNVLEYDILPQYVNDFLNAINTVVFSGVSDIEVIGVEDNPNNVFEGFTVNVAQTQMINNPYRAFRIDLTMYYYYENC